MCSRQERIQKDVEIVIQSCQAEKDCLFSDFRFTDATLTFIYNKGLKSVSYSVHVSDDYPDNTYVSNSENIDDVLVTRDPIPVIFQTIATALRTATDYSCLSITSKLQIDKSPSHYTVEEDSEGDNDSDEFYFGGQVNYDGELQKHPQLENDLAAVRDLHGPQAVSLREYGAIDDLDIDLRIDVGFLDKEIALVWDVITTEPVIVRLHCSLTQYLNGPVPTVDVFQASTRNRFGLRHQLKKVMQTFVTQQWKHHTKGKLNCPHGKKQRDKKVKSPLHIFSTLRRSPSYPPPSCTKNKKKLKHEQDGVSKSHCLLQRTSSSAVKPDSCTGKPHKLLGPSLSEQTPGLKPIQRLLPRAEESSSSRPHQLLPYFGTGQPQVECRAGDCNSVLKPHGLLQRTNAVNGLKHHQRLLGRPCSSSAKITKSESLKEPPGESRRLSLTSGLIGILAPALSPAPPPNSGAKSIPAKDRGFLVQTMVYAAQRIPVLNEFCVVCDEPHVFQNGPMLRPTACERELCVFAFQTLGVMNEAADEVATGAQVVDLLVSMCRSALESPRREVIFEPYPSVVDPIDPKSLGLNPRKKDYDRVMRALDSLTSIREMTQAPYLEIKKQMDRSDPLAHPLLQWLISSNRSHIVKLSEARRLRFMRTPHQFLLLSSPPAKESNFRAAKENFGSVFAFHGSHIENWHSILRNGLVVASKTKLQLHGAIFGNGIYLSPLSSISFGYSGINKRLQKKDETPPNRTYISLQRRSHQLQFLQSRNLKCIALCEVITSPDLQKHADIWVVPNTDHVCTRFFFVYEDGQVGDLKVNTQNPTITQEILRVIGKQTATG